MSSFAEEPKISMTFFVLAFWPLDLDRHLGFYELCYRLVIPMTSMELVIDRGKHRRENKSESKSTLTNERLKPT